MSQPIFITPEQTNGQITISLALPPIIIQIPHIILMNSPEIEGEQSTGAPTPCALCGYTASDGSSTLKEEALSNCSLESQFECQFNDVDNSNEIVHNDVNLQSADMSTDVALTTVKDEPCSPSSSSESCENIQFSEYFHGGRLFANMEEIIAYLREAMECQS